MRAREAEAQGLPVEEEPPPEQRSGWKGPDLGAMSRYGGPEQIYARRRIVAVVAIVGVILILFLLLGGC